jgi:hypothetical protein
MQLPPRDPNGCVPVRRLWPGPRGEENAEAGALVRVPSGLAVRMVLAGEALPAFADDGAEPPSGPLVEAIRSALREDAEFYALLVAARAYAFHRAGPEMDAQRRAGERMRRITGGLPRALRPASYSAPAFAQTFGAEPVGGWYAAPEALRFRDRDPKAELLAHHCRRRRFQVLMRFFDSLRAGHATACGQLPCGLSLDVPHEIWSATTVILDLATGAVTSDHWPLFDHIEVAPPQAPPAREPAELAVAA